jgi:D-alanyl-D-alanine carboxypeptidase (penicillin-binding protein 5/6)
VTSEPISVLTKKGGSVKDITQEVVMKQNLQAPLKKGDELGKLILKKDNKVVVESPLVAEGDIEQAGWWTLFKRVLGDFSKSG